MMILEEKVILKTEAARWIPPKFIAKLSLQRFMPILAVVLIYLCYGLFLTLESRTDFQNPIAGKYPMPHLADKPFLDDAYYVLTVSQHLAQGKGISYKADGSSTSGFQPLAMFVNAAIAAVTQILGGNSWHLVRTLLFLDILAHILFAGLTALLTWKLARPGWRDGTLVSIAFCITLFNFHVFRIFTNGLETGLYLILIALQILYAIHWVPLFESKGMLEQKHRLLIGVLTGFTILTRIDFIVPLSLTFIFFIFSIKRNLTAFLKMLSFPAFLAALIASPWFLWVHHVTGTWMPSSGSAQMRYDDLSQLMPHSFEMIKAVVSHLAPWIYTGGRNELCLIAIGSLLTLWVWGKTKRARIRGSWISLPRTVQPQVLRTVSLWALALLCLVPVYWIGFNASYFYARYTSPLLIVILPALALVIRYELARIFHPTYKYFQAGFVGIFFVWAFISFHSGRIFNTQVIAAEYVSQHYDSKVKVGAWQSGILGFMHPNIFNLDGKLDQEAFKALQHKKIDEFIDKNKIDVLIDWPGMIEGFLSRDYLHKWRVCPESAGLQQTLCLERIKNSESK